MKRAAWRTSILFTLWALLVVTDASTAQAQAPPPQQGSCFVYWYGNANDVLRVVAVPGEFDYQVQNLGGGMFVYVPVWSPSGPAHTANLTAWHFNYGNGQYYAGHHHSWTSPVGTNWMTRLERLENGNWVTIAGPSIFVSQ